MSAPLGPALLVTSKWPFNDWTCQLDGYFSITLAAASIHTLVLMAVNRFFIIVKPSCVAFLRFDLPISGSLCYYVDCCIDTYIGLNGGKQVF